MAVQESKELVRKLFEEVWSRSDFKLLDEILDSGYSAEIPLVGRVDRSSLQQVVGMFHKAFPDLRFEVKEIIAEGDRVACHWVSTGTSKGEFLGYPPNGKTAQIDGISFIQLKNGKLFRDRPEYDVMTLLQTMGLQVPVGGAAAQAKPQPEIRH